MNRGEIHRLTQEVKNPKPDRRTLKTTGRYSLICGLQGV